VPSILYEKTCCSISAIKSFIKLCPGVGYGQVIANCSVVSYYTRCQCYKKISSLLSSGKKARVFILVKPYVNKARAYHSGSHYTYSNLR